VGDVERGAGHVPNVRIEIRDGLEGRLGLGGVDIFDLARGAGGQRARTHSQSHARVAHLLLHIVLHGLELLEDFRARLLAVRLLVADLVELGAQLYLAVIPRPGF
jgi:hypothetical protein